MELFTVGPQNYDRYPAGSAGRLAALTAFNRINALSCIKSAEHGWLGASYSVAELLTVLYFHCRADNVVLSKGHAAAMQYACLHGLGRIDRAALLAYKNGPTAPQAHTDRLTPGILVNTGSLGQALSKTAALAYCRRDEPFYVVLGDGELQEGQVFEGCQTVVHRRLTNLTVIVDVNGFQTERRVADVKGIADLTRLFGGLGFEVVAVDGHAPEAIVDLFARPAGQTPRLVLATTVKAGGSAHLAPQGERQMWHGKVPDDALYLDIVREQVERSRDAAVQRELDSYVAGPQAQARPRASASRGATSDRSTASVEVPGDKPLSTRDGFTQALARVLGADDRLMLLNADLAHSCGLDPFTAHPRFLEMGIAEQDMVSFAGGLALAGRIPVVNTYAAFLKRAYEQIYVNATEKTKVIYAGHYAGLCYYSDGKTHQSINDLSMMLSIPGLIAIEPALPEQAAALLEWALSAANAGPCYFRLRRTPQPLSLPPQPFTPDRPLVAGDSFRRCFVTSGTVSTTLAMACRNDRLFADFGLMVPAVYHGPVDVELYRSHLASTELCVIIEEDTPPGALCSHVTDILRRLDLAPRVVTKQITTFGASFRTLADCLAHFGFTVDGVASLCGLTGETRS